MCSQCSKIVNFTNDILGTCAKLHARSNSFQHDRDADIPIRAILHGWQAVTKKYALDPLWATLRHADEMIWSRCRPTERLVVLRLLNLMLRVCNSTCSILMSVRVKNGNPFRRSDHN